MIMEIKVRRKKEMGTSFEYSKTLAMEGSILLVFGLIPYVGWAIGIVGIVLLLRAMREFANYYQDNGIYNNASTGVKYYVVALIALAVSAAGFIVGFVFNFPNMSAFGVGNVVSLTVGLVFLVLAFAFFILASFHLRRSLNILAQKTGEHSFETAGTLLWVGSILTILIVGLLLIFIAWIFAVIGFFTMKPPHYASQPNGYTQPSTQPSSEV
jgi:uncharacterized membrane protein